MKMFADNKLNSMHALLTLSNGTFNIYDHLRIFQFKLGPL